jgi:regulator of protease activity HflC (stomatin/prohibitin superfamily)
LKEVSVRLLVAVVCVVLSACSATVQPGHLGLYFDRFHGGMRREPVGPGLHYLGFWGRIEDFDVTYSTHTEEIRTTSAEGLQLELRIAVIYRPVRAELYELDTEVGQNYYDEVIGPEFRSAARGVFARHSYIDLMKRNEQVEDEVERDLRRRIAGKHLEIASVTLESLKYADEIITAVREKLAAEQDALRQKTLLENEAMRKKLEVANQAEQARLKAEATLREKLQEIDLAKKQVELDKLREEADGAKKVVRAKADADASKYVAQAVAEQARAHNQTLTPLAVQLKGYEALKGLSGTNTHIYLGDWSKVPNFLLLPGLMGASGTSSSAK